MDLYQVISYPLYAGAVLQIILGIALLKQAPRKSRAKMACAGLFFSAALFLFCTAISYTLESQGRDYNFFNRASWIGWFMIPACLQFAYYMQGENSRAARMVGRVLYPFWSVVLALTLFTDLVEPGDPSLIPFIGVDGPLEKPLRIIGSLLAFWLLVVLYRTKNQMTGLKKSQFNLFFYGTLFFNIGCILIAGVLPLLGAINPAFTTFVSLPWVVITYYAITRHRFFDLRIFVSRVLSIGLLLAMLSVMQVALFKLLSPLLGESSSIVVSLSALGILFFATRISRRMQDWVQQLVLQDKYDYQKILQEAIKAITSILDLGELLGYIIGSVKKSLKVENSYLLLNEKDGNFSIKRGFSVRQERVAGSPVIETLIAWLKQVRHGVVREELEHMTSEDAGRMSEAMQTMGAELIIPLLYKGDLKGFMVLGRKGNSDPYFQSDIGLLETLAGHAAIAIENAQLYEDILRAKESMHESEEKFRTLAETAATAIFMHQGGNFTYTNRAAEVVGGYAADEYCTMNFLSLAHPDHVEMIKARAKERLAGGQAPPQYEFKIVKKNGDERWVLMTAGISQFDGKNTVIGTLIDITDRKQAEKALQDAEARYRLLFEQSPNGVVLMDFETGKTIEANSVACRQLGYTREEFAELRISDYDVIEKQDDTARHMEKIRREGSDDFDTLHRAKYGEIRNVHVSIKALAFGGRVFAYAIYQDITEHKHAEAKYRNILQTAIDGFWTTDSQGRLLDVNEAYCRMSGYSRGELLGMSVSDLEAAETPGETTRQISAMISKGSDRFESKHRRKDGTIFDVEASVQYTNRQGGRFIAFIKDITERKQAEEEREHLYQELKRTADSLRESEAMFRSLAETAPATIFIHQGGNFLYANPASENMIGYTREEFLRMDFWGVTHPEDKDMIVQRARARLGGDRAPQRYEFRVVTKSSEVVWVDMAVGMIEYEGKQAVLGICFDITARKQAEQERERFSLQLQQALRSLQESEGRFRTLAETTAAMIIIHRGGRFLYTNPAVQRITGYTAEELAKMEFFEVIHPEFREMIRERGRARLAGVEQPTEYEFKLAIKNGDVRWANITAAIIDFEGKPAVIATLFDVTDRKRAEEDKLKLYEQRIAEEIRHVIEKEKLLMDLHDGIGGITTNISILSELAQKATDIEGCKGTLSTISRLSREGIAEIRSFMHSLDAQDLNWRTIVTELRNQGTNMVEPHGVAFTLKAAVDDVQEQPTSLLWVNLFKIYKELLTNAIKHAKASAIIVELGITGKGVLLDVIDDGIGREEDWGKGRGLSNMNKRASELGGRMTMSFGNGTRMSLKIPLPLRYPV